MLLVLVLLHSRLLFVLHYGIQNIFFIFQANVPFSADSHIQCMYDLNADINYFVCVGSPNKMEPVIKTELFVTDKIQILVNSHNLRFFQMILDSSTISNIVNENSSPGSVPNSTETSPEKVAPSPAPSLPLQPVPPMAPASPPPRYKDGMLAVCKLCGYTGYDFNKCQRS